MLARETDSRRKDNWGLRVVRILPLVSDTNVLEVTNAVDQAKTQRHTIFCRVPSFWGTFMGSHAIYLLHVKLGRERGLVLDRFNRIFYFDFVNYNFYSSNSDADDFKSRKVSSHSLGF